MSSGGRREPTRRIGAFLPVVRPGNGEALPEPGRWPGAVPAGGARCRDPVGDPAREGDGKADASAGLASADRGLSGGTGEVLSQARPQNLMSGSMVIRVESAVLSVTTPRIGAPKIPPGAWMSQASAGSVPGMKYSL